MRRKHATVDRKTNQLCGQVRDALLLIVPGLGDDVLNGLTVVSVEPAPHGGRLRVTVAADAADVADRTAVGRHLARATGAIREEVAHAITRRKVPELVFAVT